MQATPLELAIELDRLAGIPRRDLRRADPSVHEALELARQVPTGSSSGVAEKLARHAVLLRLFGRYHAAQEAGKLAVRLYAMPDSAELNTQQRGYAAYARFVCAWVWFHAGDRAIAHSSALEAVELFKAHLPLLVPPAMFDLTTLLTLLAQTQRDRGETDRGRQAVVDAMAIADELRTLPWGPPRSIPPAPWGLPVNPTDDERGMMFAR